jgi:hypothetical protein
MHENEGPIKPIHALIGVVLVAAVWCAGFLFDKDVAEGFNPIAALFSGLAFLGVIYAVILQKQELSLQRKELELTRDELKGQKEQLEAQNATLSKSNFDETFFQLLRLHHEIVASIDLRSGGNITSSGRDCFKVFYGRLRAELVAATGTNNGPNTLRSIDEAFVSFMSENEANLGHYFRSLYNLLKYVDQSLVQNKRLYTNLVRAQLSKNELLVLFYDCLSSLGNEKFKPLAERYSLFKTVSRKGLFNEADAQLYQHGAY